MTTLTIRILTAAAVSLALAIPAVAFACGGKEGHARHFQDSDKNNDGFLTAAEVGPQRWDRIKVADTNNDGKVSKDEMMQAFKAGKLGRGHAHQHAS